MLKSMTAYGRGNLKDVRGHFVVEIQSVNRKFLEFNVILPTELAHFDIDVKKWINPFVGRGQITVKVSVAFEAMVPFVITPNLPLVRQLKKGWDEIAKDLCRGEEFSLSLLRGTQGLFSFEDNRKEIDNYRKVLQEAVELALKGFLEMRSQEGAVLEADIVNRLATIQQLMYTIQQKIPFATSRYRAKLIERLEELLPGRIENEERILREIALFTDKIDISEEITRFFYHLSHFQELLRSERLGVGKTIEFVLQELNREVNTIGSKSLDSEIARGVIEIKSELERIREQVQNVE